MEESQRQPLNVAIFDIVVIFGCIRRGRIWTTKKSCGRGGRLWFRSGFLFHEGWLEKYVTVLNTRDGIAL